MLIVSELPRLTHLSIDLSRATRAHLGLCVAFSSTATQSIWRYAYWVAEWLISDKDRAKVTVANRGQLVRLGQRGRRGPHWPPYIPICQSTRVEHRRGPPYKKHPGVSPREAHDPGSPDPLWAQLWEPAWDPSGLSRLKMGPHGGHPRHSGKSIPGRAGDPPYKNRVTTRGAVWAHWAHWGSLEPCGPRVLVHGGSLGGRRAPKLVNELISLLSTKTQNPTMGPTEPTVRSLLWVFLLLPFSSYCPLLRFFLASAALVPLAPAAPASTMLRRSFMCVAVRKAPVLRVILSTARGLPLRLTS